MAGLASRAACCQEMRCFGSGKEGIWIKTNANRLFSFFQMGVDTKIGDYGWKNVFQNSNCLDGDSSFSERYLCTLSYYNNYRREPGTVHIYSQIYSSLGYIRRNHSSYSSTNKKEIIIELDTEATQQMQRFHQLYFSHYWFIHYKNSIIAFFTLLSL